MSWNVIKKNLKNLPHIYRLSKFSEYGCLKSVLSKDVCIPHTGPAWASSYTGVHPKIHGITTGGWLLEHKSILDLKTIDIWELIQKKYTLGLMTMPIIHPAFKLNGWMVSGFPASLKDDSYFPSKLKKYLDNDFQIDYLNNNDLLPFNKNSQNVISYKKIKVIQNIYENINTDVIAIGITLLDRYGHAYPQYKNKKLSRLNDKIEKISCACARARMIYLSNFITKSFKLLTNIIDNGININSDLINSYIFADMLLGKLLKYFKPKNIIIYSDHGFRKYGYNRGEHDMEGFYLIKIARSRDKKNTCIRTKSILEIPYLILKILNIKNLLGKPKIPKETITESYELSPEEEETIKNRLKSLGYIE